MLYVLPSAVKAHEAIKHGVDVDTKPVYGGWELFPLNRFRTLICLVREWWVALIQLYDRTCKIREGGDLAFCLTGGANNLLYSGTRRVYGSWEEAWEEAWEETWEEVWEEA